MNKLKQFWTNNNYTILFIVILILPSAIIPLYTNLDLVHSLIKNITVLNLLDNIFIGIFVLGLLLIITLFIVLLILIIKKKK